ncbi:hypothetical protein RDABS01_029090 [Bienertia sinuspersici]
MKEALNPIVAITYQPPDPWLQSAPAFTKLFTEPSACAEELSVVNCSDPRVLIAIERFNLRLFKKNIVFLEYSTPVNGSKPNQCDVAWKFRNRKEKSLEKVSRPKPRPNAAKRNPKAVAPLAKIREGKDFRFYFDFEHLKEEASIVEEREFLRDWKRWDKTHKRKFRGRMDWDFDAFMWFEEKRLRISNFGHAWMLIHSPEAIVSKLQGVTLKVHLLDDYKELWGNTSDWYNETMALNGGRPVDFDGYMRVEVDTEVLVRAKTRWKLLQLDQ